MQPPEGRLSPAQYEILEAIWDVGPPGATGLQIWERVSNPSSTVPRLNSACHGRKSFGGHARSRHDAECVVPKMSEGSGMRVDLSASCEHNV